MQRTFLRSDSEDLVKLQQKLRSSHTTIHRHDEQTTAYINKVLEELEKTRLDRQQLFDRNKQLEQDLRQANQQIAQLVAENQALARAKTAPPPTTSVLEHQQKRQPLIRKPSANSRTLQPQHRQRMIASPEKVSAANAKPAVHGNANKGRKRSAEKQPANGIGADHDEVFARAPPKRSLLRRSSEVESRVEDSSKKLQPCAEENSTTTNSSGGDNEQEDYLSAKDTMATTNRRSQARQTGAARSRRSMSLEPMNMVNLCAAGPRQSRLLAVRNSRISSSHGDFRKLGFQKRFDSTPDDSLLVGEQAAHSFQSKRNFLRIQCCRCDQPIRFGVLYVCCERCRGKFHEHCRKQAPLPCVDRKVTPKPLGTKHGRLRLGDYCADQRPMVPPLITYCTYHLDSHPALPFEDIYQVDGDAHEVDAIMKLFQQNKAFPKLENYLPINIAGSIKKFLFQIREPVVPFSYGEEMIKCVADSTTADNLQSHVEDLPVAHMDTLGRLCRHWKRLISHSGGQLTVAQLSECVGPLVFGATRPDSSVLPPRAIKAMAALIELPMDYWTNITTLPGTSRTPLSRNPSQRSNNGSQTPIIRRGAILGIGGGTSNRHLNNQRAAQREVAFDSTSTSQQSAATDD